MFLTIIYGEEMKCFDITPDTWIRNFLEMCIVEIPSLRSVDINRLQFSCNGEKLNISSAEYERELQTFGIKDEDVINIEVTSAAVAPSVLPTIAQQTTTNVNDVSALISSLVRGIQAPSSSVASVTSMKEKETLKLARNIFQSLADPSRVEALNGFAPELAAVYNNDPSNFNAFLEAFNQHRQQQERKIRLMHDETSEEGQRYIAELIARENIDFTHQFAMEHMPEAYIPVHMLYIRMKINGHSVIAFVDSGAQVSILSESCAKRCEISRLIDERFQATARGVGGSQKFLGRIHSCQVQVEGHIFPCPFDVMGDRNIDILFGLNMLRRHHCSIDLQKGVLRFGDGTETEFLSEEAYRRETDTITHDDVVNAIEDSKDKI